MTHPAVAPVRLRTCELPVGVRGGGGGLSTDLHNDAIHALPND